MECPTITDDLTHQQLLRVCEALMAMDPPAESLHGEYLTAVAAAIEEYEKKTYPL